MRESDGIGDEALDYARNRVSGPAVGLMVTCSISMVILLLAMMFSAWLILSGVASEIDRPSGISNEVVIGVRLAWNALIQITSVVILVGALQMKRLKNLALSRAACVLALIPCLGPCFVLGIPFGIWGLVALNDPKVRLAFRDSRGDEVSE